MAEVKYLKRKMAITFKLLWIFMRKIFLVLALYIYNNYLLEKLKNLI
jgi:hypothetical protein